VSGRPFHDLLAGYRAQAPELLAAVRRVLESGTYVLGDEVAAFEREFAAFLGAGHVVGVGSGTQALELALLATGVAPGDEVAIPALTAIPTAMAVLAIGAVPVLVDVDRDTYTMDPAAFRQALSARTRAVVPVHLYGQCADVDALRAVAGERDVAVVEDAAQAHGAADGGRAAGTLGAAAAWSFYPTKNLGAFGDAGAVSTGDGAVAERVRRLRAYGQVPGYDAVEPGRNARLDPLQAALLRVRLTRLPAGNAARAAHAARYRREVVNPAVVLPREREGGRHAYHQFVVRSAGRDALAAHLAARGLGTLVHYPRALHQVQAVRGRAVCRAEPCRAEAAAAEVLSLPIYPEMTADHQAEVIAAVNAWRPGS
jgi:dTDP-3-amino-3,4,6-trideoxy-alpha-D-glucose transaminase